VKKMLLHECERDIQSNNNEKPGRESLTDSALHPDEVECTGSDAQQTAEEVDVTKQQVRSVSQHIIVKFDIGDAHPIGK
jgi:hypothetical protein